MNDPSSARIQANLSSSQAALFSQIDSNSLNFRQGSRGREKQIAIKPSVDFHRPRVDPLLTTPTEGRLLVNGKNTVSAVQKIK